MTARWVLFVAGVALLGVGLGVVTHNPGVMIATLGIGALVASMFAEE